MKEDFIDTVSADPADTSFNHTLDALHSSIMGRFYGSRLIARIILDLRALMSFNMAPSNNTEVETRDGFLCVKERKTLPVTTDTKTFMHS